MIERLTNKLLDRTIRFDHGATVFLVIAGNYIRASASRTTLKTLFHSFSLPCCSLILPTAKKSRKPLQRDTRLSWRPSPKLCPYNRVSSQSREAGEARSSREE